MANSSSFDRLALPGEDWLPGRFSLKVQISAWMKHSRLVLKLMWRCFLGLASERLARNPFFFFVLFQQVRKLQRELTKNISVTERNYMLAFFLTHSLASFWGVHCLNAEIPCWGLRSGRYVLTVFTKLSYLCSPFPSRLWPEPSKQAGSRSMPTDVRQNARGAGGVDLGAQRTLHRSKTRRLMVVLARKKGGN